MPKISVIVCERNSEKFIEDCVNSIMNQSFKDFELIIVHTASTDSTKEKIIELQKKYSIKLIELKKNGISRARNTGIKNALGELIAFTDSDCVVEKNWLEELIKGFDEKTVSVGGPNLVPVNADKKEKIFDELLELISGIGSSYVKNSEKIIEVKHNPTCNSIYTKKILAEMNGFNEKLSSNEDPELDYRIKKTDQKIKFNPKAIVFHNRKNSMKKIFDQAFWFGLGRTQAIKLHLGMIEWFRIIPLISIMLILFLFLHGIYSADFNFLFYFITLLFSGFILISLIAVIKFKRFSLNYFFFLISWFFGYGFGMLKGVIK
ncbi:MAG: hypothetical protein COT90_03645 [Candidatus Diapherotrites archaeon CG10_big_fil_rev_8_21_14_0_10_31_34]|nr:MAG: hypothetical protein COT90_03645 [Candidatus Diapherotrites archaeon CG10_big_fil_rev_8_21_14_0_10_31_34]